MEFSELKLHPDLERGIADMGYVSCMPVQEKVLTCAFGGEDLYVQSQTGTGKTAAFLIVIFQRLLTEPLLGGKKAIIMVPTRELAVQVEEEAKALGKYLPFKSGSFYGGVGYAQQQRLLKENVQILVGTPGRVLDLNKSGYMNLMDIAFLILDEADRMFDMGFYPDLRKLIQVVPPADRRQTMLFSATLNTWVKNLAWEYTKNPKEIEIQPETVTVDEVEQFLYHVPSENKMKLLLGIMEQENPESAIIFCNTKRYVEIVARRLRINGIECEFIIGDLPQVKRLKIIDDVKAGRTRVLVATDVAARGLDIEDLTLVVNYDLPVESENYVHRIGRTARAGKTGKAVTLVSEQDVYELPDIEKYIGKKIPSQIANESLYKDDKSEGVRIKTDFYDDREKGNRDRGGQHTRIAGKGRSEGPHGRDRSGKGRDGGYRSDREDKSKGLTEGRAHGSKFDTQNLAGLSFEERMAYYKKKYEGGKKDDDKNKDQDHSAKRTKVSKSASPEVSDTNKEKRKQKVSGRNSRNKRKSRHPDGEPAKAGGNSGKQISRNGKAGNVPVYSAKPRNGAANASTIYPSPASPPGQKGESPPTDTKVMPKRGILGKVLGIFQKK